MYGGRPFGAICGLAMAAALLGGCSSSGAPELTGEWADYLGGADSAQFSPLSDINSGNVGHLQVAWSVPLPNNGQSNGNPLVIDGRMFVPYSGGILALDPATGRELWRLDAEGVRMRGLSSWDGGRGEPRRLFYNHQDRLYAIEAATGKPVTSFGDNGSIDLKQGLGRDPATIRRIESQSPGRIFDDLIIVGTTGGDEWNGPPGYIRAFDVRTGKLRWTFHSIPHPGEAGYETWPKDAWKQVGGVNNWSEMTLDTANGILFVPLASADYNFYGVNRKGSNLYANSLVALDARTGKRLWHFQTVHHDLWDYDLPQAPKLLTLNRNGKRVEAVAVAGKTGFIYTFERRTGKPVFPIEERPVPKSDIPGEEASPTQPFPTAPEPFVRQRMTAEDLSPYLDPAERKQIAAMIAGLRNEGIFTPPSRQGTLQIPGSSGGTNWGNGAVDPRTGRFFVVGMDIPAILRMEPPSDKPRTMFLGQSAGNPGEAVYAQNCASCHGEKRAGQPPAIPALTGIASRRTAGQVSEIVTRGRAVMPAFNLKPQEMKDLLLFLGFSQEQAGKVSSPAVAAGPDGQGGGGAAAKSGPIKLKTGYNFLFSKTMLPASAAPWSTMTAYDMNSGKKLWQVPFGELPGLKDSGTLFPRGTIVATAGDLIFAGTQDRKLRAWSMADGKLVWQAPLPSVPGGVPAVYKSGGRQFIALMAGSYDPAIAKMSSVMSEGRNSIVAFALPKK